jgi:hypothetical protein
MIEFADSSILDLIRATQFLHYIKPSLRDKLIYALEKPHPSDRSVVFHLMDRKVPEGEKRTEENTSIFILSAEYILEHPFWKGTSND